MRKTKEICLVKDVLNAIGVNDNEVVLIIKRPGVESIYKKIDDFCNIPYDMEILDLVSISAYYVRMYDRDIMKCIIERK